MRTAKHWGCGCVCRSYRRGQLWRHEANLPPVHPRDVSWFRCRGQAIPFHRRRHVSILILARNPCVCWLLFRVRVQTPRRRGNPRPLSPPTGNCADVLASDHCRMFELRRQSLCARYSGPCLHGYGCGIGFCSLRVGTSTIAQSPTAAPHSWPLGCCKWVFVNFSLPHILIIRLWLCQLSFASTVPSCTHPIGSLPQFKLGRTHAPLRFLYPALSEHCLPPAILCVCIIPAESVLLVPGSDAGLCVWRKFQVEF